VEALELTSSKAIDMHIDRYGLLPMARTIDRGCLLPTEQSIVGHYPQQLSTLSSPIDNILNNLNVYLIFKIIMEYIKSKFQFRHTK